MNPVQAQQILNQKQHLSQCEGCRPVCKVHVFLWHHVQSSSVSAGEGHSTECKLVPSLANTAVESKQNWGARVELDDSSSQQPRIIHHSDRLSASLPKPAFSGLFTMDPLPRWTTDNKDRESSCFWLFQRPAWFLCSLPLSIFSFKVKKSIKKERPLIFLPGNEK